MQHARSKLRCGIRAQAHMAQPQTDAGFSIDKRDGKRAPCNVDPAGVKLIWGRVHRPRHLSRLALNTVGDITQDVHSNIQLARDVRASSTIPALGPPSNRHPYASLYKFGRVPHLALDLYVKARVLLDSQLTAIHLPGARLLAPPECRHAANEGLRYNLSRGLAWRLAPAVFMPVLPEGQLLATSPSPRTHTSLYARPLDACHCASAKACGRPRCLHKSPPASLIPYGQRVLGAAPPLKNRQPRRSSCLAVHLLSGTFFSV
jgi:hypothetical protein